MHTDLVPAADAPVSIKHNQPPKKLPVFRRTCPECSEKFETNTKDRLFCSNAHKANFHNRSSTIGRTVIPLAMAWRAARNAKGNSPEARALRASGARAFADMCRLLDAASADDREQGRMAKLQYVRRRNQREGTLSSEESVDFHIAADAKAAKADQPKKG